MSETRVYRTLCCAGQWAGAVFRRAERRGDTLVLSPGAVSGTVCLRPVDSGERGFRWSRLKLSVELPPESSVRVYARSSDESVWEAWDAFGREDGEGTVRELFGPPAGAGTDLWLDRTGRYLWLAFELSAGGTRSPSIRSVSLRMGGDHMADYLPALYQGQDLTYRFLSIFDSMFQDMDAEIEDLPRQLDPMSASPEFLDHLGRWLCLMPERGPELPREMFAGLLDLYEDMFTPEGVCRSASYLAGKEPMLIEHFSVDPNDPACPDPALYRELYGDDPYRFFLLLPQDTFRSQQEMEHFLYLMRELIPAETELELVLLKPCIQLGWHTYLGVNSRIGSYVPAAIDESMTIHYDTTIGGTDHER